MTAPFDLGGRVALVTGAAGGLGRAMAGALHGAGAALVLTDIDERGLANAASAFGGRAETALLDITDAAAIQHLVDGIMARHGRLDILLNNAGMGAAAAFLNEETAQWRRIHAVNLDAVYLMAKAAAAPMAAQGWGRIVNIASIYGMVGSPRVQAYAASKHAVVGLTRAIAAELGPCGVTCNAIGPGYVRTAMTAPLQGDDGFGRRLVAAVPVGRWAEPADLAGPALFLCSPGASYVNGHLLLVDGGMTTSFL
ncbi:SDR family NAD(P)-dependent oxidoreductase [Marinibaculum pumilum]|uniref:SDR family NAD(P)-dependent oxidoreductase n=1 Tax=Marinibaculum pumilum TaxID=1766165 RepID=A0ABV7KX59_9PROT